MIKNKSTILKQLVESEEKNILKDIISNILKLEIEDIEYNKKVKLNNLSGYDFELVKLNAKLIKEQKLEIYLKMVKKTKIKESIFCYWCSIYDEELVEKQERENVINKVVISELTKSQFQQSIFLEIENNKTQIMKNGTKVVFLEMSNYIKEYGDEINKYQEIAKYFRDNENEVLLIGIKTDSELIKNKN